LTASGHGAGRKALAPSTIIGPVSGAMADIFRYDKGESAMNSNLIRNLKKAARRLHPQKSRAKEALPIKLLQQILQKCYDQKSLKGYRDAAIMMVMFTCWLRQSEVMRLQKSVIASTSNVAFGPKLFRGKARDCVTVTVEYAKNDQERKG